MDADQRLESQSERASIVTLLLRNHEIVPLIDMRDSLGLLEEAYKAYARGKILNVPWSVFTVPGPTAGQSYRMFELRASSPDLGVTALRVISTVIRSVAGAEQMVPGPHGKRVDQVFLFDHATGETLAILAGDHIQLLRVGATSALGVKYLARAQGDTLGIIGTGDQAESQLEAMALTRDLKRALIYSRSQENRERFVQKMQPLYPFAIEALASPELVVEQADIITSATNATAPTFDGSAVRPGSHVNTLGPAQVDDSVLARASLFTSSKAPEGHAMEHLFYGRSRVFHGHCDYFKHWARVQELEQVMIGSSPGRRSEEEITVFHGPGAGLQFLALGYEVYKRAREKGIGQELPTEWFVSA